MPSLGLKVPRALCALFLNENIPEGCTTRHILNKEGPLYTDSEFKTMCRVRMGRMGGGISTDISWTCSVIYHITSLIRGINVSLFCSN
jgi:hypothetical protein